MDINRLIEILTQARNKGHDKVYILGSGRFKTAKTEKEETEAETEKHTLALSNSKGDNNGTR